MNIAPQAAQDMATPPHSQEAEMGVLGSMLQLHGQSEAISACAQKINAEYFFVPAHQEIFTTISDLWDAQKGIDLITVTNALRDRGELEKVGGAAYVTDLFTFVPTAANAQYYVDIMLEKYIARETRRACEIAVRRTTEPQIDGEPSILDQLESRIASLRSLHGRNGFLPLIEDAALLLSKPILRPDDVIEGVLRLGAKMVLGGASKAYKTWLLADTAISVATGTHWLGKFPTRRGRVRYINLELDAADFTWRLSKICDERQLKIEPGYLDIWNLRGHAADLSKLLPQLLARIRRDHYALIILDPIYKLLGGRDENKAGDIASLLNEIESLAVKTCAAVAFGAHYSKGNQAQKESIDRIGGSGVFARDPDSIVTFTRHETDDCFSVETILRSHPPIEPFVVRWTYPLFVAESTLDPAKLKQAGRPQQYQAQDLLDLIEEPMSASEIVRTAANERGIPRRTVFELLDQLKTTKKLRQPERHGKYERV